MAKTKGPLLSLDAHGTLADLLTYSSKRSGSQVRLYNKPLKPASAKQRGQRRLTEFLVAQWQNMSAGDKATWEANAAKSGLNLEGYHYFLREAQRNLYLHTGLVGYWHCNEIVGGKVLDLSGNANHAALEPDCPTNAPILANSKDSRVNKALLYDGVDEYIEIPNSPSLNPAKITIEFLVHPLTAEYQVIIAKHFNIYLLFLTNWNAITFEFRDSGNNERSVTSPAIYPKDVWHWAAMSYDGISARWYLNGVKRETDGANFGDLYLVDTHPVSFGVRTQDKWAYFHGYLDEMCIYNRVLSDAEIKTRYKIAATPL